MLKLKVICGPDPPPPGVLHQGPSFSLKEECILFSYSSPSSHTLGQLRRRNSQLQLPPGLSSALGLGEEDPILLPLAIATETDILWALRTSPQRGCGPWL